MYCARSLLNESEYICVGNANTQFKFRLNKWRRRGGILHCMRQHLCTIFYIVWEFEESEAKQELSVIRYGAVVSIMKRCLHNSQIRFFYLAWCTVEWSIVGIERRWRQLQRYRWFQWLHTNRNDPHTHLYRFIQVRAQSKEAAHSLLRYTTI